MYQRVRTIVVLFAAALFTAACAPKQATSGAEHNLVTAEELGRVADMNLYDALRRLRPAFLRSRQIPTSGAEPQPPTVYVGSLQMMEGLEHLRQITAGTVAEVRFLEPQQANTRFGTNNAGGALVVTMK